MYDRNRTQQLIIAFLMSVTGSQAFAASGISKGFDSSFLKIQEVPGAVETKKAGKSKEGLGSAGAKTVMKFQKRQRQMGDLETKATEKELAEAVHGLTQLISATRVGAQRYMLVINRAMTSNILVRKRVFNSKEMKVDAIGAKYLASAVRDVQYIIQAKDTTPEMKAKAKMILGSSYVIWDRSDDARKIFEEVLAENVKVENADWMALVVAEELFEIGQFSRAIPYYERVHRSTLNESREYARYKVAWCYINLGEMNKAEEIFVTLVRTANREGAAKDSMRDLAYIISHKSNPSEAIPLADQLFQKIEDRIQFLNFVRMNLEGQNTSVMHSRIVERLLQLDQSVEGRLNLLIANFRVNRKQYVSHLHFQSFTRLRDYIRKANVKPDSNIFEKVSIPLEGEMQNLMKSFIDTYAARIKTPEAFSKEALARALKDQFEFFNFFFPVAKARPMVVSLWMNVCGDIKDWLCVDQATEVVFGDPKILKDLMEDAYLNQCLALEELIRSHPLATGTSMTTSPSQTSSAVEPPKAVDQKYNAWNSRLRFRLKNFLAEYRKSKQWLRTARRYIELMLVDRNFKEALVVLEQVFLIEKTADSFYRLQSARYQAGDYKELIEDRRGDVFQAQDPRIIDIRREVSLTMAVQAKKSDNFKTYQAYLNQFLQMQPDANKALVAREDYFRTLVKKEYIDELVSELLKLPPQLRFIQQFMDLIQFGWAYSMRMGKFDRALQLLSGFDPRHPQANDYSFRRTINQLAMGKLPTSAELRALPADRKEYLLGVFVLLKPSWVLELLEEWNSQSTVPGGGKFSKKQLKAAPRGSAGLALESDRDLALLALRIETGQWKLRRSDRAIRYLGSQYPFVDNDPGAPLSFEKQIEKLNFPSTKTKPAAYASALQFIIAKTQNIRTVFAQQIAGKDPRLQLRAVKKAADLERKVVGMIIHSPIPGGLTPEQLVEYKKGLEQAAAEYETQAKEYDRFAEAVQASLNKVEVDWAARLIARPDSNEWPWPSVYESKELSEVRRALEGKQYLQAMILADYLRSEYIKDDSDYFLIRTGILIASNALDAMRYYLIEELEKNQKTAIIESWKKLVPAQPTHSPLPVQKETAP